MSKDDRDDESAARDEARDIERYDLDERALTPLGLELPRVGFVPDVVVNIGRFVWLGLWIALFPAGQTALALVLMFGWIAANGAYEKHRKALRRERKRQITQQIAARQLDAGPGNPEGAGTGGAAGAAGAVPAALSSAAAAPSSPAPPATPASPAEKALVRTLRRVETSERFERRDAVLVGELADVLFPLLAKVAEPGADPLVRRDVETIASDHLPDSVDAYLALPAEHARTHRNSAGRTPLEELRVQLDLLLTGCEQLQEAVLRSDVSRQQAQSRFLEEKFRPSGLDL
ncbi:hypothetical protein [Quadrisphaera sp. INWT6]|uniref:hypothetical protein n=1 Tax=Quadrisphaera sp. INWT6 TaxID=2596917 RepID=UPI0018920CF8|nr:hypothetical protein [Quadrisphaera sp. INWT6]MBF5080351.1 hypothetical protein [Quadrisphaera sp. INWT6]